MTGCAPGRPGDERRPRRPQHQHQLIALELRDQDGWLEPVEAALTSREARELAFRLLELADLADHRARGGHR
jgi:hypothetical protein